MKASFEAGSLDAAAFHAQQAVEKLLKAFLVSAGTEFPHTHNLARLVGLCATIDKSFGDLLTLVEPLTPYAVELRYDSEFWPSDEDVQEARATAIKIREFVVGKLNPPNNS